MQVLRGLDQFNKFLDRVDCSKGCLADTGFLYGMTYKDDHFYPQSLEVSLILEERNIPIHTNVIGRMVFIDLVEIAAAKGIPYQVLMRLLIADGLKKLKAA